MGVGSLSTAALNLGHQVCETSTFTHEPSLQVNDVTIKRCLLETLQVSSLPLSPSPFFLPRPYIPNVEILNLTTMASGGRAFGEVTMSRGWDLMSGVSAFPPPLEDLAGRFHVSGKGLLRLQVLLDL